MKTTNGIVTEERLAWRTLRSYAIVLSLVVPMAFFVWINKYERPIWQWVFAFFSAVLPLLYVLKNPKMSLRACAVTYFIITFGSIVAGVVCANHVLLNSHDAIPFDTFKFLALILAFLAPRPKPVGFILIGLCCFIPPAQVLLSPSASAPHLYYTEPWSTMGYAIAGLIILKHRLETRQMEIALAEFQAREKSWSDFADVVVALRDLTNSPVQSLEILIDLLKNEKVSYSQASDLLDKEVYKLREISEIFAQYQRTLIWKQGTESFDSLAVLRQKLSSQSSDQSSR